MVSDLKEQTPGLDQAKILQTKPANSNTVKQVIAAHKLGRMMKHKQRRLNEVSNKSKADGKDY